MNKLLVSALSLLVVSGCGSSTIMLVHPKTGERVECRGQAYSLLAGPLSGRLAASLQAADCANQYEGLGFVRAENLTPEQRANLVSKPRPIEVQQDITVREGESKK